MGNTFMQSGAAALRAAIERQRPDDANFRRVRYTGGSMNRVQEKTGQTRNETDFRAVENPTMLHEDFRAGASGESGDLELHVLDDLLEEGDRVERISDGTPYRVTDIEDVDWSGEQIAFHVTLQLQHD